MFQLSARIFNISEQSKSGTVRIELIDPETEKVVFTDQQSFTVEAGKTGHATFRYQPSEQYSLLVCRMMAAGADFSDGEQHYLPILPDKERVTKSVPFTQHEPGVKAIDLTKLFPTGTTQQKLTIEYTNNPAWLMVQSLSALSKPYEKSAIDQASPPFIRTCWQRQSWTRLLRQRLSLSSGAGKRVTRPLCIASWRRTRS